MTLADISPPPPGVGGIFQYIDPWQHGKSVFQVRISSDPLLLVFPDPESLKKFTDQDPAYSSEYHGNKLKILSLTHVLFFLLVTSTLYLSLWVLFLSVMWCFKKLFLLTITRRWVGSGSVKYGCGSEDP
jgi:hypothetical protein